MGLEPLCVSGDAVEEGAEGGVGGFEKGVREEEYAFIPVVGGGVGGGAATVGEGED